MFSIFIDIELFEDKRQDIRFTKQISVTIEYQISFPNSIFVQCFADILEKRDFDWGGGVIGSGGGGGVAPKLYS